MPPKNNSSTLTKNAIRIRMYRVGFGDCFLVSFPTANDGFRHFVIDCGVHGQGNIGTIEDAVDDIAKETGGKIAAIIATHSHQDHISGFSEKFSAFDIGEVWLPWADDPDDKLAKKWNKKQAMLVSKLANHFAAQARRKARESTTKARESAIAAIANLTQNKKAMGLLRDGFNVGAKVRYLAAGKKIQNAARVEGLHVQVLGPPREEKFLSKMDPPVDQRWLRLDSTGGTVTDNATRPFSAKWLIQYSDPPLTSKQQDAIKAEIVDTSLDSLAFALDHAKNNTSLVTLFVYRGKYLLFPGDAQYGNWQSWIEKDGADDILEKINFLKVGHHGSHNATPKEIVPKLVSGSLSAMVSTQSVPWDSIPKVPLMEKLYSQCKKRVVRSDWIGVKGAPKPLKNAAPEQPDKLPSGFTEGAFWYDLQIRIN